MSITFNGHQTQSRQRDIFEERRENMGEEKIRGGSDSQTSFTLRINGNQFEYSTLF